MLLVLMMLMMLLVLLVLLVLMDVVVLLQPLHWLHTGRSAAVSQVVRLRTKEGVTALATPFVHDQQRAVNKIEKTIFSY